VISLIRPINEPSRRVAERIGMRAGGRVRFHGFEHIMYVLEAPSTPSDNLMHPRHAAGSILSS